jgi:hypothetical protein
MSRNKLKDVIETQKSKEIQREIHAMNVKEKKKEDK